MAACGNRVVAVFFLMSVAGISNGIRCSICETNESGQQCLTNPPAARLCGEGFHYCISVARYFDDGELSSFTRSCSPIALPDSCFPSQDRKTLRSLQVCYLTCSKDGCNSSSSLHHILDLIKR